MIMREMQWCREGEKKSKKSRDAVTNTPVFFLGKSARRVNWSFFCPFLGVPFLTRREANNFASSSSARAISGKTRYVPKSDLQSLASSSPPLSRPEKGG